MWELFKQCHFSLLWLLCCFKAALLQCVGSESLALHHCIVYRHPWTLLLTHASQCAFSPSLRPGTKVLLAKRKNDGKYYAIKVLQKRVILNRREVASLCSRLHLRVHLCLWISDLNSLSAAQFSEALAQSASNLDHC